MRIPRYRPRLVESEPLPPLIVAENCIQSLREMARQYPSGTWINFRAVDIIDMMDTFEKAIEELQQEGNINL